VPLVYAHTLEPCLNDSSILTAPHVCVYFAGVGPFDRVLCDVPCSGDGTVRKTLNIWRSWLPSSGLGLHALQLQVKREAETRLLTR
jgi:16S rRNA C967 or C1407 C5-methylase (RsmB/RsmF family)